MSYLPFRRSVFSIVAFSRFPAAPSTEHITAQVAADSAVEALHIAERAYPDKFSRVMVESVTRTKDYVLGSFND